MYKGHCVCCGRSISEKSFKLRGNYCLYCNAVFNKFAENKIDKIELETELKKLKENNLTLEC